MIAKEILQDLDGDDLTPPPYWIMTRLPSSATPGPEAALEPDPGPGEVPASSRCSSASSPRVCKAAIWAGSDPGDRSLWPTLQDPAPAKPPKLYPPLLVSTDKKGETLELSRDCALPESWKE